MPTKVEAPPFGRPLPPPGVVAKAPPTKVEAPPLDGIPIPVPEVAAAAKPAAALRSKRAADVVIASLLLALGVLVLVSALRMGIGWGSDGPESGFVPFWL